MSGSSSLPSFSPLPFTERADEISIRTFVEQDDEFDHVPVRIPILATTRQCGKEELSLLRMREDNGALLKKWDGREVRVWQNRVRWT